MKLEGNSFIEVILGVFIFSLLVISTTTSFINLKIGSDKMTQKKEQIRIAVNILETGDLLFIDDANEATLEERDIDEKTYIRIVKVSKKGNSKNEVIFQKILTKEN